MSAEFSNPLFGCFNNCALCITTYFAPCYTAGKNAETVGNSCLLYGLLYMLMPCVVGTLLRNNIRTQKQIQGSVVTDIAVHVCCPFCALIQEAQEVRPQSMARE